MCQLHPTFIYDKFKLEFETKVTKSILMIIILGLKFKFITAL
jgi:hypothetical protein